MTAPRIPDMIGRYARLSLSADTYRSEGKPVPLAVTREMESIEARARAVVPPEHFHQVISHVDAAKAQLYQQAEVRSHEMQGQQRLANREAGVRGITKGLGLLGEDNGLSYRQFEDLKSGKKVSVGNGPRPNQEAIDKDIRARTARVDPSGKGWTQAEWTRRLDELADASESQFAALAQQYKASPQELRQVTDNWGENRVQHKLNVSLHERDAASERSRDVSNAARANNAKITERPQQDDKVEPSERDVRDAQLLDAFVTHTDWSDRRSVEFATGDISKEMQEEDSARGDIARAWVETEAKETAHG